GPPREEGLDLDAAMDRRAVPDDEEPAEMAEQMEEELAAVRTVQGLLAGAHVELARGRHAAQHGEVVAGFDPPQLRPDPAGRVGAHHTRRQVEPGFIDEDEGSPGLSCGFFSSGHTSVRHRAISASSRWRARRSGRCGDQSSALSSRETCARWYPT